MDKIYNLQETIYNDKIAIKDIERELTFRKSILSAHEKALERALSPKEYSPFSEEKPSESITERQETPKERITLENWRSLGIIEGDKVEIVISFDSDFKWGGIFEVVEVDTSESARNCFIRLDRSYPYSEEIYRSWYAADEHGRDELYLIRTKEGSGN